MQHHVHQDYLAANYCPTVEEGQQDFCVEKLARHYIGMLVSGSELENVKSFTRTNIIKPDFTPRKARKSRHFWHFKPTKQNLWGFL